MRRVEVGDLGNRYAIVFEDLRTLEFRTGQRQLGRRKVQAQARIDNPQLGPLAGFIAGQVLQGFWHVERHVIRD
ncbi:hypothetical protein D3C81_2227460 [compost metagenome]